MIHRRFLKGQRRPSTEAPDLADFDIPAALTDGSSAGTALGPHGGAASLWVDRYGWAAPIGMPWSIDWQVRTGDGWEAPRSKRKTTQQLVGGAAIETSIPTAVGSIVHRVAVGVVGGKPAAIIELVNNASVAVAVALAFRPFGSEAAGVPALRVGLDGIEAGEILALSANRAPSAIVANADDAGIDVLADLDAQLGADVLELTDIAGRTNAALIWALPHTATLRAVVPLIETPAPGAAVPGIDDIIRGWDRHLADTARFEVDDTDLADAVPALARDLLCRTPKDGAVAEWMIALAELGLGREAVAGLEWISDEEEPASVIFAIGRLAQLGFGGDWQEDAVEPLARAAHRLVKPGSSKRVPVGWRAAVVTAAADLCRMVDQPDVAERLDVVASTAASGIDSDGAELPVRLKEASPTWAWASPDREDPHDLHQSALMVARIRNAFVQDDPGEIRLLPHIPSGWRGHHLEAHQVPVASGEISFGVRWHGERPALLWEFHPSADSVTAPGGAVTIRVPGISSSWSTTETTGEALLPDPEWG